MTLEKNDPLRGMEDNLKRAVTEMLVLSLLDRQDMHAAQITHSLEEGSGNTLSLASPYMLFYRLIENGFILEAYKKIAPDGRRRQYYQITEEGRAYLAELTALYHRLTGGVALLLTGERVPEEDEVREVPAASPEAPPVPERSYLETLVTLYRWASGNGLVLEGE